MISDMDTLRLSFIKVAKNNNDTQKFDRRRCPDNRVLRAQFQDGIWTVTTKFERSIFFPSEKPNPCIFLILESPHKKEFESEPPMPAAGSTGTYIEVHLDKVLNAHVHKPEGLEGVTFDVVLMNAIQFQTSLGRSTSKHRDDVFRGVWERGGNVEFCARLADYVGQGDIIINACTAGKTLVKQIKLREAVEIEVKLVASKCGNATYRFEHPSTWDFTVNTANTDKTAPSFVWRKRSPKYIELSK